MPDDNQKTLRVHIDGDWTADQMAAVLLAFSDAYGLYVLIPPGRRRLRELWDGPFPVVLVNTPEADPRRDLPPYDRLQLRRMKFGSKGVADLLIGIGEALRHIHAIIKDLLEMRRDWQAERTKKLAEANIAVAQAEQERARADQADAEARAAASKAAAEAQRAWAETDQAWAQARRQRAVADIHEAISRTVRDDPRLLWPQSVGQVREHLQPVLEAVEDGRIVAVEIAQDFDAPDDGEAEG